MHPQPYALRFYWIQQQQPHKTQEGCEESFALKIKGAEPLPIGTGKVVFTWFQRCHCSWHLYFCFVPNLLRTLLCTSTRGSSYGKQYNLCKRAPQTMDMFYTCITATCIDSKNHVYTRVEHLFKALCRLIQHSLDAIKRRQINSCT